MFQWWWGYLERYRFWSRYAVSWRLVHYVLCVNPTNIHFEVQCSRLSDPPTHDVHWPKDMRFWWLLLYISMYY
jgi:hypothetical protein